MKLRPERLLAGVLEPVFAIRTGDDLGVGDTEGVRQMIDWCHRRGLGIFQTLPINELSDDNSPYNAISALAIEPATLAVSPEHLPDLPPEKFRELATPDRLAPLREGPVNYPKVKKLKRALLEAAFETFIARHHDPGSERAAQFQSFRSENARWLSDYAFFRALMEENGDSSVWEQWMPAHRTPRDAQAWLAAKPAKCRVELSQRQLFFEYVQWIAFSQWRALKDYAGTRNVSLMGDVSFGVGRYSADVWANRDLFDLDWSGGAPPETLFKVDPFTEKWGQNWGIPLYRWKEFRRRKFDWWRTRIYAVTKIFNLYRIDHALGFFRIYAFPWTPDQNAEFLPLDGPAAAAKTGGTLPCFQPFADDSPEHRTANRAQGEETLRVVIKASGETTVIAEDLGVVPDYVPMTLQQLGIPGFRVPMLFRESDGAYSDPKAYPRLTLAQPTTHDHPPLAAAWAECWTNIDGGRDAEKNLLELRQMMDFAGLKGEEPPREFNDRIHEAFTRAVMQSNSWLVVFQITDIFAQSARFNTPGATSATNWSHRLPQSVRQLDREPGLLAKAAIFSRLAKESGRAIP